MFCSSTFQQLSEAAGISASDLLVMRRPPYVQAKCLVSGHFSSGGKFHLGYSYYVQNNEFPTNPRMLLSFQKYPLSVKGGCLAQLIFLSFTLWLKPNMFYGFIAFWSVEVFYLFIYLLASIIPDCEFRM